MKDKARSAELAAARAQHAPAGKVPAKAVIDDGEADEMQRWIAAEIYAMSEPDLLATVKAAGALRVLDLIGQQLSPVAIRELCDRLTADALHAIMALLISEYTDLTPDEAAAMPAGQRVEMFAMCIDASGRGHTRLIKH